MKKTTLAIMAAGVGSRYGGGIKQLAPVGPNGEIIMDYSIYDALEAGFDKVVFIIRKDLESEFRETIGDRVGQVTEVAYAFQELKDVPEGCRLPKDRLKPWGTGQAILAAREVISEPFCVINADDYYGKSGYRMIHEALVNSEDKGADAVQEISMAAFVLKNTLSDNGGVTRGLLSLDGSGRLKGVTETKHIIRTAEGAAVSEEAGLIPLDGECLVSMNMWGLQPSFIELLYEGFREFLQSPEGDILQKEYLLPTIIDELTREERASVQVLRSEDVWFGMTYKEDHGAVCQAINHLISRGVYPGTLFGKGQA